MATVQITSNVGAKEKTITVITRDNIRKLHPHTNQPKPSSYALVLDVKELDRIKNGSLSTQGNNEKRVKESGETRNQMAELAQQRKLRMEAFDRKRAANSKLSDIEQETKEKNNYLLAKAQLQLEEQEDEIKHMNELMLSAKCVAIRDLQVNEKKNIAREGKMEESRLDAMMESDRVKELQKLGDREKKRQEELRNGAKIIRKQIEERREAAILEQERRDQEVKALLKAIEEKTEQDKVDRLNKVKAQKALMKEVVKANMESIDKKKQEKFQELEEDRQIMEYLLKEEQKKVEVEKQAEGKKVEREQELARLRAAQQRVADKQAEVDAVRAQRAFESYERDWRKKEKESAEKAVRMELDLREERVKQQRAHEYAIAIEAHKMKQEFFENLDRQKLIELKLKDDERVKSEKNRNYFLDVKAQISVKEGLRRKEREDFFMEGVRLAKEQGEKKTKMSSIKQRKLAELRGLGVDEKYCKEIERQVFNERRHL